jgi:hypothetical protein
MEVRSAERLETNLELARLEHNMRVSFEGSWLDGVGEAETPRPPTLGPAVRPG